MKIKKIEYQNFRNFKEHGEITFSTDGKINIIYGKNGDGKTTLHQLFQWIFYGDVKFNKTATDRLYNLSFEREQALGAVFQVVGVIDFEHNNKQYSLRRVAQYKKGITESERMQLTSDEELQLQYLDSNNNWKKASEKPQELIELAIPRGLAEYFFFDGETMIADLRVKGKDSASKLRKALYSMFELDILEAAVNHIGSIDSKTTVLGKLFLQKGEGSEENEVKQLRIDIDGAQNQLDMCKDGIISANREKRECQDIVNKISEQIGNTKSKSEYEEQRKTYIHERDTYLKNAEIGKTSYGEYITDNLPQLLISNAVQKAKKTIHLQVEQNKLPEGLNHQLIEHLLDYSNEKCVCGHILTEEDREYISAWLKYLPPASYASLYNQFSRTAELWGKGYDKNKIIDYINNVIDNSELAEDRDLKIKKLDDDAKNSPDIENLVVKRVETENRISELERILVDLEIKKKKAEVVLKKTMKAFDLATKTNSNNILIDHKILIMEKVKSLFSGELKRASDNYSTQLQFNIEQLMSEMLTSKREVNVTDDFSVTVYDSYKDEAKSEGQFAVVSFAYIGGILKMIKDEDRLQNKEYPLVLDGPFSKLDEDQRLNVINTIPKFAPQIILFSKDNLQFLIEDSVKGKVWTIESNAEKNIAKVKEGFLW